MASSETLRGDGAQSPSSPVDLAKVKVGDEVTIRARVTEILPGRGSFRVYPPDFVLENDGQLIGPRNIVSHTPKALEVGDVVTMRGWGKSKLRLLCIFGNWAWMADAEGSTLQGPLVDLERAS